MKNLGLDNYALKISIAHTKNQVIVTQNSALTNGLPDFAGRRGENHQQMEYTIKLLKTFDFHSLREFLQSLAPSFKYRVNVYVMSFTMLWVPVDKWFGLDDTAFVGLLAVFLTEILSGIAASRVRRESFSSLKLSRFGLKATCYMVLIFTSYTMYMSFKHHSDDTAAIVFDWLHIFLVVQIVFENVISVLENVATITGKDKSAWISKAKEKLDGIFG